MNEWGFDFEKLNQLLLTLTEELYLSKIPSIEKNFELAKHYIHPEKIINEYFKQNS